MTNFIKQRQPLTFLKWISISIVFFTLSVSLWAVVLNKDIEANLDHIKISLSN